MSPRCKSFVETCVLYHLVYGDQMTNGVTKSESNSEIELEPKTFVELITKLFKDRVGDPLWRSYIFFFIISNWKSIGALFLGKEDMAENRITNAIQYTHDSFIKYILNFILQDYYIHIPYILPFYNCFLFPLFFAWLYIYFYLSP